MSPKTDIVQFRISEKDKSLLAKRRDIIRAPIGALCESVCKIAGGTLVKIERGIVTIKGTTRDLVTDALQKVNFHSCDTEILN